VPVKRARRGTSGAGDTAGTTGAAGAAGSAGRMGGAGADAGAGTTGAACHAGGGQGGGPAPEHRPVAVACAATPGPATPPPDAAPVTCTTNTDCQPEGGAVFARFVCRGGACTADQCLTDDDCPVGQACGCANQVIGLGNRVNSCLPSSCRIDADCGPTGLCSPAHSGHCGSLSGYHCRKAADACQTNEDCPCAADAGPTLGPNCEYAPEVDRWQCLSFTVCGG
jgi:hypothetical protein